LLDNKGGFDELPLALASGKQRPKSNGFSQIYEKNIFRIALAKATRKSLISEFG